MATSNTTIVSTPLDDLKDVAWLTKERLDYATDSLSGRGVEFNDGEEWAFDDVQKHAIEALAKHIPGMRYGSNGLPIYDDAEAFRAARTYDDGTPVIERIQFEDVPGYSFIYRPRYDMPRAEFMVWAREQADQHKADDHARYVSVGELSIEYIGEENGDFSVRLGDDAHVVLHRLHMLALYAGIDRLLNTQTLEIESRGSDEDEDKCETPQP